MNNHQTIYQNLTQLIGSTPLMQLNNYGQAHNLNANIIAKLEYFNPGGSIKDRVAQAMIKAAEAQGKLKKGSVIIEPTSGNTGIGLALVGKIKGYEVILTMPETMSIERRNLLQAYGAKLVLTDGKLGMKGAIAKAQELAIETPNSFIPDQFANPANPQAHKETTGPEIWQATQGKVDIFLAGIGTGGTITGVGEYLKAQNPQIQVIGIEPAGSPVISQGKAGAHGLQGIGAGFIPPIFNQNICNEIITVKEEDAYEASRAVASQEGLLVGISAGAALWAATITAQKPENKGKNIVVILPDTGERYLSTPLFAQ